MATPTPPGPSPEPPVDVPADNRKEFFTARYGKDLDAWLEEWKQRAAGEAVAVALRQSREDAVRAAETASLKSIEAAYIATSQSSLDRALTRMNVVTASVSAVIGLYTALLAYVYTVNTKDTSGISLSLVAFVPVLFLGLSLFLVTVYAALLRNKITVGPFLLTGLGVEIAEIRLLTFMNWCFAGVLARRWALHAGIVSLGVGVATLPIAFILTDTLFQVAVFVTGLVAVFATGFFSSDWWSGLPAGDGPPAEM
jgi:hypothetical protein